MRADVNEGADWLRLLILGPPKVGKSTAALCTSPGPRFAIECDPSPEAALAPVRRRLRTSKSNADKMDYGVVRKPTMRPQDLVRMNHYAWLDVTANLKKARDGVSEGRYTTVVLDTLSELADSIECECAQATFNDKGEPDGRRYWYVYEKRLRHIVNNLFTLPAHVIVVSHYMEVGDDEAVAVDGVQGTRKRGKGIVPLLGGKARATIPSMFNDVVFMDFVGGKRVFTVGPLGAWGPGCRSFEGATQIDADVQKLIELFAVETNGVQTDTCNCTSASICAAPSKPTKNATAISKSTARGHNA